VTLNVNEDDNEAYPSPSPQHVHALITINHETIELHENYREKTAQQAVRAVLERSRKERRAGRER